MPIAVTCCHPQRRVSVRCVGPVWCRPCQPSFLRQGRRDLRRACRPVQPQATGVAWCCQCCCQPAACPWGTYMLATICGAHIQKYLTQYCPLLPLASFLLALFVLHTHATECTGVSTGCISGFVRGPQENHRCWRADFSPRQLHCADQRTPGYLWRLAGVANVLLLHLALSLMQGGTVCCAAFCTQPEHRLDVVVPNSC